MSFRLNDNKNAKSNSEMALILYSLAFSVRGKEQLREIFKAYSQSLIKRLNEFYLNLEKEGYWKETIPKEKMVSTYIEKPKLVKDSAPKKTREEVKAIIERFTEKMTNLQEQDIEQVKAILDKQYFIGNVLTLEGFVLGFYDFVKQYFQEYYDIIALKYESDKELQIRNEILSLIEPKILLSKEAIETLLDEKISNLETYDPMTKNIDRERAILEKNTALVKETLNYQDFTLIQKLTNAEANPKGYQKFLDRKINPILINSENASKDRTQEFDDDIFQLVENVVFGLLKFRKSVINKELYKSVVGTY